MTISAVDIESLYLGGTVLALTGVANRYLTIEISNGTRDYCTLVVIESPNRDSSIMCAIPAGHIQTSFKCPYRTKMIDDGWRIRVGKMSRGVTGTRLDDLRDVVGHISYEDEIHVIININVFWAETKVAPCVWGSRDPFVNKKLNSTLLNCIITMRTPPEQTRSTRSVAVHPDIHVNPLLTGTGTRVRILFQDNRVYDEPITMLILSPAVPGHGPNVITADFDPGLAEYKIDVPWTVNEVVNSTYIPALIREDDNVRFQPIPKTGTAFHYNVATGIVSVVFV